MHKLVQEIELTKRRVIDVLEDVEHPFCRLAARRRSQNSLYGRPGRWLPPVEQLFDWFRVGAIAWEEEFEDVAPHLGLAKGVSDIIEYQDPIHSMMILGIRGINVCADEWRR